MRKFSNGTKKVQAGILWQGDTIEKVQLCPSFQGNSNMFADPFTGYNYNTSYIGHGQNESIVQPARTQEVRRPSSCVLFGDSQTVTGANKFMRSPLPSDADPTFPGRWGAVQGFRHSGNTNLIWCDGSVASKEQIFTRNNDDRTKEVLEEYNATHPPSPIASSKSPALMTPRCHGGPGIATTSASSGRAVSADISSWSILDFT